MLRPLLKRLVRFGFYALGLLAFGTPAWTAPIQTGTAPDLSVLDSEISAEEHIAAEGLSPATPESGNENPEDLLKSSPSLSQEAPKKTVRAGDAPPEELPPLPEEAAKEPDAVPEALEIVDVPAEPDAVASVPSEGQSTKHFDRSIPPYDRENPTVGIDIHASLAALGTPIRSQVLVNGVPTGAMNESSVRNFGVGFEFEPKFLQSIGVVSLGPSVNMYALEPIGDLTESALSILSVGFSAKYQLKFMRSQVFVPFAGFEAQMIHYAFHAETGLGSGWTTSTGPTFGGLLLLNWMEPSSAHNLYSDYGIKRTYLVGEAKLLKAGEPVLSVEGTAIYFGLRMEY